MNGTLNSLFHPDPVKSTQMKKITLISLLFVLSINVHSQLRLDLETGLPFQGYNEVRIPNQEGTLFDFNRNFELQGPVVPIRLSLGFTFGERNHISGLFAPLTLNYEGAAPFDIQFENTLFPQAEFIEGLYRFNSYRLTYRRDLLLSDRWTIGLGLTAKIRDARVRLVSDQLIDQKDDLGFVPLLNILLSYKTERWTAFLTGDGLAAAQGRAFDFFLGAGIPVTNRLSVKTGYRVLEGGADVEEVYNFTLVHFAVVGLIWN